MVLVAHILAQVKILEALSSSDGVLGVSDCPLPLSGVESG